MGRTIVVALGGNALLRGNQKGTVEEQIANTLDTMEHLVPLLKEGVNLVIGHGNGPQVGNILMQQAAGEETFAVPSMPLDVCVAESQGFAHSDEKSWYTARSVLLGDPRSCRQTR